MPKIKLYSDLNYINIGFELTTKKDLAAEYAVHSNVLNRVSLVYEYELRLKNLNIADLYANFNTLQWLAYVLKETENKLKLTQEQNSLRNNIINNYTNEKINNIDILLTHSINKPMIHSLNMVLANQIDINLIEIIIKNLNIEDKLIIKSEKALSQLKHINTYKAYIKDYKDNYINKELNQLEYIDKLQNSSKNTLFNTLQVYRV